MEEILKKLNIVSISKVESYRISYEWNDVDFDIDIFPDIPPFLEIDLENYHYEVSTLLEKLNLTNNEVYTGSTIDLYKKYGKDYLSAFKVS